MDLDDKLPSIRDMRRHGISMRFLGFLQGCFTILNYPVKNVTWISSCLSDDSLLENKTKSDGNPIIFLANAMEIP